MLGVHIWAEHAETRDRAGDLQIFGLTLSQLSYRDLMEVRLSQSERSTHHMRAAFRRFGAPAMALRGQSTSAAPRQRHWARMAQRPRLHILVKRSMGIQQDSLPE